MKTFMTTYRSFCTPSDLLTLLIERFNIPTPYVFAQLDQQFVQSPLTLQHKLAFLLWKALDMIFWMVRRCSLISRSGGPLAGRFDTVQSHGLQQFNHLPQSQLEQAFHRFRQEYQKPIQLKFVLFLVEMFIYLVFLYRVLRIMNHWVCNHFYDFDVDGTLLKLLVDFLSGNDRTIKLTNNHKKWCAKILVIYVDAGFLLSTVVCVGRD